MKVVRGAHASIGHAACQHRIYDMDCSDLDDLIQRAEGRCEICRIPPGDAARKRLYIDHDHRRGNWATRGLLCAYCNFNSGLDGPFVSRKRGAAAKRYLASPWFAERYGDGVTPKPEPEIGTSVAAGISGRIWTRTSWGWHSAPPHPGRVYTWAWLNRFYVPFRIEVIDLETADVRPFVVRHARRLLASVTPPVGGSPDRCLPCPCTSVCRPIRGQDWPLERVIATT